MLAALEPKRVKLFFASQNGQSLTLYCLLPRLTRTSGISTRINSSCSQAGHRSTFALAVTFRHLLQKKYKQGL